MNNKLICPKCNQTRSHHIDKKGHNIYVCYNCRKIRYYSDPNYRNRILSERKEYDKRNADKIKERKRIYRIRNIDHIRQKNKEYYANNLEKIKEKGRSYYKKNRTEIRKKALAYDKLHRKEAIERAKKFKQLNPIKRKLYSHIRRQRLKGFPSSGSYTEEQIIEKLKKQNYKCVYCNRNIKQNYTIDHIVPLSRHGNNNIENIDLICRSCNNKKHTKTKEEYVEMLQSK